MKHNRERPSLTKKWFPAGLTGTSTALLIISDYLIGLPSQLHEAIVFSGMLTILTTLFTITRDNFIKGFIEEWEPWTYDLGRNAAQNLQRTINRLPGLIKLKWIFSGFEDQYRLALLDNLCDLETEGYRIGLTLSLEEVFVPLRVVANIPENIVGGMVPNVLHQESQKIWDFLSKSSDPEFSNYRRIAVIAPPGFGKTTLLKHITVTYARKYHKEKQAPELLPVLLYLRTHYKQISADQPPELSDLIQAHVQSMPAQLQLVLTPEWIEDQLKQGKFLVMFDGLDEVADLEQRQKVSCWVDKQLERYRKSLFVLTSRPDGYSSSPLQKVGTVLMVLPFSPEQTKKFVRQWYLQTEIRSRARNTPKVRSEAQVRAEELIARVSESRVIREMSQNPLLATMIATIHYYGKSLPEKRVVLYQEICNLLLGPRQRAKNIEMLLSAEENKSILQVLAFKLMQRKQKDFSLGLAVEIIQATLEYLAQRPLDPKIYLKQLKEISGLLVERETDVYEFAHLSFQEYLAAAHIKEIRKSTVLVKNVDDPWWHETIRLYAAQSDVTRLIIAVLQKPTVETLLLANELCIEEGVRVKPDVRKQLEELLKSGLESPDLKIARN